MLYLTESHFESIVNHCKKEYPLEACGLLVGEGRKVKQIFPMNNVKNSNSEYLIDPEQQFKAFRRIWREKKKLLGIYHSHPQSEAFPSVKDKKMAFYPEVIYIIVSLQNFSSPEMRGFRIKDGKVTEEKIKSI